MNISFAEYLNEQLLKESGLSTEKITIDYLNKHCSKAIWMAQKKTPIWRGDFNTLSSVFSDGGMSIIDTLKTTRKSANTKNYYTLIFDYIFSTSMTQFPLRSKSIICTTDKTTSYKYGGVMAVIPTDNAKIGFVDADDIWHVKVPSESNGVYLRNLTYISKMIDDCGIPEDINSIKNWFNGTSHDSNEDAVELLHKAFPSFDKFIDCYKEIINTNFKTYTSANVPMTGDNELWISGDIVLIDDNFWRDHIKRGTDVTKWELK